MPEKPSEQGTVRYVRCPSCGTPNPGTSATCSRCGKPMEVKQASVVPREAARRPAQQVICSKCHKPLPAGSKFCGFCGAPLPVPASAPAPAAQDAPTAPMEMASSVKGPKASAPVGKPSAPPSAPPSPPVVSKGVGSPPGPPVPARPAGPVARPQPAAEGTHVFTGLKLEANLIEVNPDGSTGKSAVVVRQTFIGRGNSDLNYPDDVLLSPRHASVEVREGKLLLKDQGSQNGTYLKQRQDSELTPGDVFLLGRELFRFTTQSLDENPNQQVAGKSTQTQMGAPKLQRGPVTAKLVRIQLSGEILEEFRLEKPEITIGRTNGDLVFKDDPYMSGTHARILAQPGRFVLQDLKSRNGVYRRIQAEAELRNGDEFFLGEHLFRVEIKNS